MSDPTWDETTPTWEDTVPSPVNSQFQSSDKGGADYSQPQTFSIADSANRALQSVVTAPGKVVRSLTPEKMSGFLPAAGGVVGSAIAPGLGSAAGVGIGQILKRAADIGYGKVQPAEAMNPSSEAVTPMVQTALAGLPEVQGVKTAVNNVASNLGRRALGFSKGMIKRLKGGTDEANQAANEMLQQGVIRPFSGAKATLARAEDVAATSGKAVGEALAKTGQNALDTQQVGNQIIGQLAPKYQGGAYAQQEKIANEILDTVSAHSNGGVLDFQSAQDLKNTLKHMAGNNWNTDKLKAAMYQKAYGIVSDAMENAVQNASNQAFPGYIRNKAIYGASQKAIAGLEDKQAAEAANSILSLRGAAIGAGALASGHVTPALEALGVWEAARRVGAGTGASVLYGLNNSPALDASRRALLAEFISRVTTKDQNQ